MCYVGNNFAEIHFWDDDFGVSVDFCWVKEFDSDLDLSRL